jgi:conjugal transfer pilus assembly protein TraU
MMLKTIFKFIYMSTICSSVGLSAVDGKFVNPFTDVCWECLFPITINGVNVTPGYKDQGEHNQRFCFCAGTPPRAGIPISFWEPCRLVDVTRHAYRLIGLGGITVGRESITNRGSIGVIEESSSRTSFYHVHWYTYPLFSLLGLFSDFPCVEKGEMDIYMTELDPLWKNDLLSVILNPEAALFSSSPAQLACMADCASSSYNKPSDKMFWCAGCEGSLYPFTGTVPHHEGAVQASALLVHRIIAKLHRALLVKGYEEGEFCQPKYMPIIKKSLYKTQMIFPIPQTKGECHALGKSDLLWGMGKSYPKGGEDFSYLVWVKKQTCLDAIKPTAAAAGVKIP